MDNSYWLLVVILGVYAIVALAVMTGFVHGTRDAINDH